MVVCGLRRLGGLGGDTGRALPPVLGASALSGLLEHLLRRGGGRRDCAAGLVLGEARSRSLLLGSIGRCLARQPGNLGSLGSLDLPASLRGSPRLPDDLSDLMEKRFSSMPSRGRLAPRDKCSPRWSGASQPASVLLRFGGGGGGLRGGRGGGITRGLDENIT